MLSLINQVCFFIDGPGGIGKTFLYCALYAKVRLLDKIVLPTTSSGIAAAGLPNGRTTHSRFKLPIDHASSLVCDVPKQGSLAALLKQTTLIIWDEAPMANKTSIHSLDLLLRDLCDPHTTFGGKIVAFGGDFRQVLPAVPHKSQKEAVEASLVSSTLWPEFTKFQLEQNMRAKEQNMRAKEDFPFASFLLALGDGKLQSAEQELIQLPANIAAPLTDETHPIDDLLHHCFPKIATGNLMPHMFTSKAILAPKNDEVDIINQGIIERIDGEVAVYTSFDSLLDDSCNIYPTEFLHTLCPGGMSPHELVLKRDCPVILLRNLDPSSGLCNGTRLICKAFYPNIIVCEIAVGFYKGQQTFLPRINLRPSSSSNFPFQFERKQFPIKLSFAMTINKAQGQTLDDVAIYLRQPCFSHGQLYVALSRARQSTQVKVLTKSASQQFCLNLVQNVISFDVLSRAGII